MKISSKFDGGRIEVVKTDSFDDIQVKIKKDSHMISIDIPGFKKTDIEHVVFDYNGTIARDGELIKGVREGIAKFSSQLNFHVIIRLKLLERIT